MRLVLVTGGTGGIGSAIVRRFATAGYQVAFTYCSNDVAARQIELETGGTAIALDFSEAWLAPPLDVDVLVNCAGVNLSGHDLFRTTVEELETTFSVNVVAPLRFMQAYGPGMITRGWGRIVNVNSTWGFTSAAKRASYAMSKHALRALTLTAALELAAYGVTVNEVCPGAVKTPMLLRMAEVAVNEGRFQTVDEYLRDCSRQSPDGRLVSASSVASAVAFLASEEAQDILGQSLHVSGGSEYQ